MTAERVFYRIVVPTDFSGCAEEAWALAKRLAAPTGGSRGATDPSRALARAACNEEDRAPVDTGARHDLDGRPAAARTRCRRPLRRPPVARPS